MVTADAATMLEFTTRRNVSVIVANLLKDGEKKRKLSFFFLVFPLNIIYVIVIFMGPFFRLHMPRSWLKPSGNLLVVFEEWGGDPSGISVVKRTNI